ncbi:hypothetical protein KC333_g1447 [Hortaea werneckii]|nr:hypothetical protein KC333_g1447 [Hortaea werneckii]KAI7320254.1 hypothetical protein KC326_g2771 [Hortaea werneckii]
MCRIVLYDYTPCGHQSDPSLQRCHQAVGLDGPICSDVDEEDQPEVVVPMEEFCPSCASNQSYDLGDSASHHHNQPAAAFPDARPQSNYGHLQGDEAELDHLALQTALEASKLDVREEEFRETIEATELEAEEYECRMMEEVLKASFEEMPGIGVWKEQNDLLRRTKQGGGWGQAGGVRGADKKMEDLATRLDRLSGRSEETGKSQRTSQAASKRSVRPPAMGQSTPLAFPSKPDFQTKSRITSAAPSVTSDINSLPQRKARTLRSMTDVETVASGGTAVPAPQNNLRGPRRPSSPPRSPMEAAGDLEREEQLRRAKYERMKSGSDQDGRGSVIGGDRMPGFEDLPGGIVQGSVVSDDNDEDEEDDGSGSGEIETIRRLESRSSGSRFSRRPF